MRKNLEFCLVLALHLTLLDWYRYCKYFGNAGQRSQNRESCSSPIKPACVGKIEFFMYTLVR